ncbi:MAG: hypothetical protein D6796_14555 [Caldilineae bacterium]|nr:MAG: hypothetical protein D6796_14555 [Caldilineae bacterium]
MKLGIMQPYFFPYLGYFDLIHATDQWIVFDTVQYIRHGWMNRNRILHPVSGWQYIVVPLKKHPRHTPIKDVQIAGNTGWQKRILGQLAHYKKQAPHYTETMELVEACLSVPETSLSRLNVAILEKVCARLEIDFRYRYFSEMGLELGPIESPGDWALRISAALGAEEYINPPGGAPLFDAAAFARHGIRLTIRTFPPFEYSCGRYAFIPNLSVIDALMWNPPEAIKAYLDTL